MATFVAVIHVLLCLFMIFVILLQPGKDAGMGAALGGGAATSAFGGRGAVTFLSKITAVCASAFFLTSLGLSFAGLKTSVAAGISAPSSPAGSSATADAGTKKPDVQGAPGTDAPPADGTGTAAPGADAPPAAPTGTPEGAPPAAPAAAPTEPAKTPEQPK